MSFVVVSLFSLCLKTTHQIDKSLGVFLEGGGFLKWENSTILCAKHLNIIKKIFKMPHNISGRALQLQVNVMDKSFKILLFIKLLLAHNFSISLPTLTGASMKYIA